MASRRSSNSISLPAPVGGWNARDSISNMEPLDAVELVNWFPNTTDVLMRYGYTKFAYDLGSSNVESLLIYNGSAANEMWGATGSVIMNISAGGQFVPGDLWIDFPPVGTRSITTPDSAALDIVGDIDLRAYIQADQYAAGYPQNLITKTSGLSGYKLSLDASGNIDIAWSAGVGQDSDNSTVSVTTIIADGENIWVRATLDVNDGAGNRVVNFYTSDDGSSWTQLGATITTVGTTSIATNTSIVNVGSGFAGNVNQLSGKIFIAQIYNGIAGSLVAEMDANDGATGTAPFVSSATGETWTPVGVASIKGGYAFINLSNARFEYINVSTTGGYFLMAVNGVDKLIGYDGTDWWQDGDGAHDITGIDTATVWNINLFKERVWLVEANSLSAWYLAVNAIAGAATEFPLTGIFRMGGYLVAMGTWTIDAGYGVDDLAVFITSQGEVAVYKLDDPTDVTGIQLVGIFNIGAPIGLRCMLKYQGDLLLITLDGVVPLSGALQSSRVNPRVALTDKIRGAMSLAADQYRNNFGWQMEYFPAASMLILNVPVQTGSDQRQFVMNTITGSWGNFQGWEASCWALYEDDIYFGGFGFVGKAWDGYADDGNNIDATALQAFNYFRAPGLNKRFTMIRPNLRSNGIPAVFGDINVDFDTSDTTSPLSFTSSGVAVWDVGVWDTAVWAGDLTPFLNWQGATGIGYSGAVRLRTASSEIETHWTATDIVFEQGGVL